MMRRVAFEPYIECASAPEILLDIFSSFSLFMKNLFFGQKDHFQTECSNFRKVQKY